MQIGNIVAASNPILRFSPVSAATLPTVTGPAVAPRSPAKARKANIAVPPPEHLREERLIVPGHIIPTASPQRAQPIKPDKRDDNK